MAFEKIKDWAKYHMVDTTSLLTATNPAYSASEVFIAGMPDQVSIDSRLTIVGISYTFMGPLFARGRDFSRRLFGITDQTKERTQLIHDVAYAAAFNLVVSPIIYLSMGADIKQATIGAGTAAVLSIGTGPLMGYAVDVGRDLTGLRDCERASYPDVIKRQRPVVKKSLAGVLVAASIATMAGIYALTPNDNVNVQYENTQTSEVSQIPNSVSGLSLERTVE